MRATPFLLLCCFAAGSHIAKAASIRGVVEGPSGVLGGAEVTLLLQERQIGVVLSRPDGGFAFENLAAGSYQIQAVMPPYLPVVKQVIVGSPAQDAVEVAVRLESLSESVTVTAGRIPVPAVTSVSDVKIVTGDDLRTMPYQALDERLRSLPEFSLFRRSSSLVAHPTTQGVSLRGIGPSGVSRSLVLAGGVPLNDAFGGWVYWDRIPTLGIQQVEVANGGGSNLYGNYALGGVVQLLKRIPEPATFEFQGQGGSRQSLNGDLYASHRLGDWGFSVAGSVFDFDGYPIVSEADRGAVDLPAFSRHQAVRVYLERAPAQSSASWFLEGGFLNEHRGNGTTIQTNQTVSHDVSLGAQWSPGRNDRMEVRAFFRRNIFGSNFSAVADDRNSERQVVQQHVPSADGGASLQWYATRGRHRIVAGSDFWLVSGESADSVFFGPRVGVVRLGGGKQATVGFFAEENYALSSRATVIFGGRVDVRKNYDAFQGSFPPGQRQVPDVPGRTETVFSPRAGFTYQFDSGFSMYGSAYRSFRAPTLNELFRGFRVGNVTTNPNRDLVLERNAGGEYGVRYQPAENWRLSLAGFLNVLDQPVSNVTVEVSPAGIIRQRQNLGKARIYGLQAAARWRPSALLQLEANYLWDRASVTEFSATPEIVDNRLPQVPEHRLGLRADLSVPKAFRIGLFGRFVGEQFDDDANAIVLGRFFLLDAHISRDLGESARAFLALENVTDTKVIVNRSPVDFIGAPFQVRGGVFFRFRRRGL